MQEEEIPEMINEIFDDFNIEESLDVVGTLVSQMEELIASDDMWENAMTDETSRRVIVAAVGVIALKFAEVSDAMIDFINNDDE
jgi:hypothetical protein